MGVTYSLAPNVLAKAWSLARLEKEVQRHNKFKKTVWAWRKVSLSTGTTVCYLQQMSLADQRAQRMHGHEAEIELSDCAFKIAASHPRTIVPSHMIFEASNPYLKTFDLRGLWIRSLMPPHWLQFDPLRRFKGAGDLTGC
ncbi:uncharacterized protein MYCFIDRAFT_176615 [Pseudocercospora fijiensis CIRAD86]|uniref:Uncharacterized protein n=1 Tax=Pseudocercospora fijiensis (strain CIRAD86) TaxID=383855 RepID=M2YUC6_PSEFD|nr:uncharacterized protein MYCFIDRAFT_176615 [Pseudocercospora fijiensis CIRAD86]EME81325.1 hypothetical protein MYCFIDRAFT_176615 [Pseudocercospora fijiensis CIRAD86]